MVIGPGEVQQAAARQMILRPVTLGEA